MLRRFKLVGTLAFFATIPALFFYLQKDERTRVVVMVDDKILVLKGWYGPNKWMLPGGGMYKGEDRAVAAARELREETGIVVEPEALQYVTSNPVRDSYGLRYKYHLFTLQLTNKELVTIDNFEICDSDWRTPQELLADEKGVLKATRSTLATWREFQNLV